MSTWNDFIIPNLHFCYCIIVIGDVEGGYSSLVYCGCIHLGNFWVNIKTKIENDGADAVRCVRSARSAACECDGKYLHTRMYGNIHDRERDQDQEQKLFHIAHQT
jgi:hypothetical protein